MKREFTYLKKKVTAEFMYSVRALFWNQKEGKELMAGSPKERHKAFAGVGVGADHSCRGSPTTTTESSFFPSLAHPVTRSEAAGSSERHPSAPDRLALRGPRPGLANS